MIDIDRELAAAIAAFYMDNMKHMKHLFRDAIITPAQYKILKNINKIQPCKMGDLSNISCVSFGSLTVMVNKLVEEGYVDRIQCTKDRRIIFVKLSAKGEKYLEESNEQFIHMLENKVKDIPEDKKIELTKYLLDAGEIMKDIW